MVKHLLILTILAILPLYSFTQISYPRKVIINGDTVVAQTIEQTRWVSKQLEIGKACEESGIQKDSIIGRYDINQKNLLKVVSIKDELISSKDSTIAGKDVIIGAHEKINADLTKDNKHLKTKNTLILIGTGIIVILSVLHL